MILCHTLLNWKILLHWLVQIFPMLTYYIILKKNIYLRYHWSHQKHIYVLKISKSHCDKGKFSKTYTPNLEYFHWWQKWSVIFWKSYFAYFWEMSPNTKVWSTTFYLLLFQVKMMLREKKYYISPQLTQAPFQETITL